MSASVRAESGILIDFHFSEGGDFEFCSTFLRFQKVGARDAIWMVRVCAGGEVFHHEVTKTRRGHEEKHGIGWEFRRKATYRSHSTHRSGPFGEIATLRLAEPRSGRRRAGGRGERQLDRGVGRDKARRGPGGFGGAMLRAASGEACDGAMDHRKSRALESRCPVVMLHAKPMKHGTPRLCCNGQGHS